MIKNFNQRFMEEFGRYILPDYVRMFSTIRNLTLCLGVYVLYSLVYYESSISLLLKLFLFVYLFFKVNELGYTKDMMALFMDSEADKLIKTKADEK